MNDTVCMRMILPALLALSTAPATALQPGVPAFPEAEGYGMFASGGRGGDVYRVTTLADYGEGEAPIEGSLRAALEAKGPRIVVFRTGGTIQLVRPLIVENGRLTIAGQTAPGEGITIADYALDLNGDNTVVRHIRVRPGDAAGLEQDAISIRGRNVILDHVTATWGTDETVSLSMGARNVTIQWSLIAESLNRSVHSKGAHGYGSLLSDADSVTIHHSVYAFHRSRSPRPKDVLLDFRNNLVYGWGERAGYNIDDFTRMNYVANYLEPLAYSGGDGHAFHIGGLNSRIHIAGNVRGGALEDPEDDWALIDPPSGVSDAEAEHVVRVEVPFPARAVRTHSAVEARNHVLAGAGALPDRRDAADARIFRAMRRGEGGIIDSQDEVGGWPVLKAGTAPVDDDADGMPDEWESMHGLDASDPDDHRLDADQDGYTNIEEYLNGMDPQDPYGWTHPPVIEPPGGTAFADGDTLTVTLHAAEPGHMIRYTLDGSEPGDDAMPYDGPIHLTTGAHVRARQVTDRPTTTAFASYDRVRWLPARTVDRLSPGLRYTYFEADDWDEGATIDNLPALDEGVTPVPDPSLADRASGYGLVYEGWIRVPMDGVYTFFLSDDARSRLFIDDEFIARGSSTGFGVGHAALREGLHRFHYRSLHETEWTRPRLEWQGPGIDRNALTADLFAHTEEGS